MFDFDALMQPFDDDAPSGEDLRYDEAFMALELANQPGEERVVGDALIPATDPDYAEVAALATELLGRTKDIRVAVILANATLRTEGLIGFEQVLRYIRRCLEAHWDSVHPQLEEDDDDDPTMRINAVLGLTDRETVLRSLRLAPLTESRALGHFGLRDLQVADGETIQGAEIETAVSHQTIAAAFEDTEAAHLSALAGAAQAILDHVKAISAVFDEQVGAVGPQLDPLQKIAYDIKRRLGAVVRDESVEDDDEDGAAVPPDETGDGAAPAAGRRGPSGAINSPQDVVAALDRIVDYYARCEPSSPLPLLLKRARRLVSADFVTIMKDMAPQGVENVALIGGLDEPFD